MIPSHIREKLEEMIRELHKPLSDDDSNNSYDICLSVAEAAWSLAHPKVDKAQEEKDAAEYVGPLWTTDTAYASPRRDFLAGRRSCPCRKGDEK